MKVARFLLAIALAGIFCLIAPLSRFRESILQVVDVTVNFFRKHAKAALKLAMPATDETAAGVVGLVQAKAFLLRLMKRERPVKTSRWNLSPSI